MNAKPARRSKPLSKKHAARQETLLQDAITKFKSGLLLEAGNSCQTILNKYPAYADAKHLLGIILFQLGDRKNAIILLEETLLIKPNFLDAKNNLGNIYFQSEKYENAIAIFKSIIKQNPELASAYFSLGNVYVATNNINDAIQNYQKAISLNPVYAEALNNLGTAYLGLNKTKQALEHFEQAVKLAPDFADAYNNIGNCLKVLNRNEKAIDNYKKAIKLRPDFAVAFSNLGNIYQELGQLGNAIDYYKQSLAINPADVESYYKLSSALRDTGAIEDAIIYLKKTIELKPDHYDAHNNLGNIYYNNNHNDDAITEYKIALSINPSYAEAYNNWGNVLFENGSVNEAIEKYEKALQLKPGLSQAHKHLAIAKPDEKHIDKIEKQLNKPNLSDFDCMNYHFALGTIYNHIKSYSCAFQHFGNGNQIVRKMLDYSADEHSEYINKLIKIYSTDFFQHNTICGSESERPVFIVGMPRSGTTLIEQILSSHSETFGAGELTRLHQIETSFKKNIDSNLDYPECITSIKKQELENISHDYLDLLNSFSIEASRITDKLPDNFLRIGLIKLLFPNAKIIHCERNTLDTCTSIYLTYFTKGNKYSFDLIDIGRYYLDYERLMLHWHTLFPGQIYDVKYEDLITDQENSSRQLIDYINLEWEDACLNFHNNDREVKTASNLQVRQPIYNNSVERWKRYEQDLQPLIDILKK